MSDKMYNRLKKISLYYLPALSVLYVSLAKIWGLPYAENIMETISELEVFIGVCLVASTKIYKRKMQEELD